jgi:hypothetical protein
VKPNVELKQLRTDGDDDNDLKFAHFEQAQRDGFDFTRAEGCSDEAIAIAFQHQGDPHAIEKMLQAGTPIEQIIQTLSSAHAPAVVVEPSEST